MRITDAVVSIKQPDELSFVDEDIQELFRDCNYIMGMPLMAQLIKELRKMTELKKALRLTVGVLDGTVSAMGKAKIVEQAYRALGERP